MSTREGRREGFVGWMQSDAFSRTLNTRIVTQRPGSGHRTPVYVQPLVEGEPYPGDGVEWLHGSHRVEILSPPWTEDGRRKVRVQSVDLDHSHIAFVDSLARAPETREVHVTIAEPGVGQTSAKFRVDARDQPSDLMAAIRGAVEVETP